MKKINRKNIRLNITLVVIGLLFTLNLTSVIAMITSLTGDLQQNSNDNGNRFVDVTTDSSGNFYGIWRPMSSSPIFVGSYNSATDTWTNISFTASDVSA